MPPPHFIAADPIRDRATLLELNIEYISWVSAGVELTFGFSIEDIVGQPIPEYAASVIHKVCGQSPPHGAFYLVDYDGRIAGMGGLREINPGIAEIKRFYIRPAFRGKNLGSSLLQRVLADAVAFGFKTIRLDSGPFMLSAHRLYLSAGFVDRPPYPEAEVPSVVHHQWRFMERLL